MMFAHCTVVILAICSVVVEVTSTPVRNSSVLDEDLLTIGGFNSTSLEFIHSDYDDISIGNAIERMCVGEFMTATIQMKPVYGGICCRYKSFGFRVTISDTVTVHNTVQGKKDVLLCDAYATLHQNETEVTEVAKGLFCQSRKVVKGESLCGSLQRRVFPYHGFSSPPPPMLPPITDSLPPCSEWEENDGTSSSTTASTTTHRMETTQEPVITTRIEPPGTTTSGKSKHTTRQQNPTTTIKQQESTTSMTIGTTQVPVISTQTEPPRTTTLQEPTSTKAETTLRTTISTEVLSTEKESIGPIQCDLVKEYKEIEELCEHMSSREVCCRYVGRDGLIITPSFSLIINRDSKLGCVSFQSEQGIVIQKGLSCKEDEMRTPKNECPFEYETLIAECKLVVLSSYIFFFSECYIHLDMVMAASFTLTTDIDAYLWVNFYPNIHANPTHYIPMELGMTQVYHATEVASKMGNRIRMEFLIQNENILDGIDLIQICMT